MREVISLGSLLRAKEIASCGKWRISITSDNVNGTEPATVYKGNGNGNLGVASNCREMIPSSKT